MANYGIRNMEIESKTSDQYKPGEVTSYKLPKEDLEKKYPTTKGNAPSGVGYAKIFYQSRGGRKLKKLSLASVDYEGKIFNKYRVKGNKITLIKGNQSVSIDSKQIKGLIDELKELQGVVANG